MDVVAQENGLSAGALDGVLAPVLAGGSSRAVVGLGSYSLMVRCGELGGVPAWTFTTSVEFSSFDLNAPSVAYVDVLARGLVETAGWSRGEALEYLGGLPGAVSPDAE